MKKISKMSMSMSNNSKLIFILVFILVGYFIWYNKLETYTEKKRVDYPGNDIWKNPKNLSIPDCISECQNTIGCKGIVTNFKEGTYKSQQNNDNDPPKCWLKNRLDGNGQPNTNGRFTYIL
jgi:hypothetical protein